MTNKGEFHQNRELYTGIYFGSPYPQTVLIHEDRLSIVSDNSPRVNGKLKLKPNNLDYLKYRIDVPPCHVSFDYYGYPFDYKVEMVGNIGFYDQLYEEVEASAAARYYAKVGELKLNLGQALEERKQTIDLVASTTRKLASTFLRIYRDIKNKRYGDLLRLPKQFRERQALEWAGQKWLEYTYGWKPLVQDVYGAMVATVDRVPLLNCNVKITMQDRKLTEEAVGEWIYKRLHILKASCSIRSKIAVDCPGAVKAHELGLDNPALLVWELLPYSFVVDWFIPIGNWLEAQTALTGLAVLEPQTTVTTICQTVLTVRVNPAVVPRPFRDGYFPTTGTGMKKVKRRRLLVPSVPLPTIENGLESVSHALSGIALLGQAFGRKTPWDNRVKGR